MYAAQFADPKSPRSRLGQDVPVDPDLRPMTEVIDDADSRLNRNDPAPRVWPTGFEGLDLALNGGLRPGNLVLLAGAQGLGKTTWALQMARNAAREGREVLYFCYEHDGEALLGRLIAMETGELGAHDAAGLDAITRIFDGTDAGGLAEALAPLPFAAEGLAKVLEYAPRLHLHRSSGTHTTMAVISAAVEQVWHDSGQAPMVFVDYLQKVPVPHGSVIEDERITLTVEALKDMALAAEVPVVAIAAADKGGLERGKRMRAAHLRGSTALAYEADVLLILSEKYDVVARHHLVYGNVNAEHFRDWAVLTIEKNRNGRDNIDLEFRKRFSQSRYEGDGERVAETLIDERVYTE